MLLYSVFFCLGNTLYKDICFCILIFQVKFICIFFNVTSMAVTYVTSGSITVYRPVSRLSRMFENFWVDFLLLYRLFTLWETVLFYGTILSYRLFTLWETVLFYGTFSNQLIGIMSNNAENDRREVKENEPTKVRVFCSWPGCTYVAPSDRLLYTAVVDTRDIGQIKGRSRFRVYSESAPLPQTILKNGVTILPVTVSTENKTGFGTRSRWQLVRVTASLLQC